jgi:hypothetical protein
MAMTKLTETEVLAFLGQVERGEVTLTSRWEPQDVYCGNVPYEASNGWHLVIFNDCNEWDYVDQVTSSDGRVYEFDDGEWQNGPVNSYSPTDQVAWEKYGIPGYLNHSETRWPGWVES